MQKLLHNVIRMTLTLTVVSVSATSVFAATIAGVEAEGEPPVAPADPGPFERGECDVFINFDDVTAPCVFLDTGPLRDEYAGLGVTFSGIGPRDGAAILNECSGFGVSGHSSPNFLAVNCGATYPDGGSTTGPIFMDFSSDVSSVSVLAGSFATGSVTMDAYDGADLVDTVTIPLSTVVQVLGVSGAGIDRVEVSTPDCFLIIDDLCINSGPTPVEETTWGRVKSQYRSE